MHQQERSLLRHLTFKRDTNILSASFKRFLIPVRPRLLKDLKGTDLGQTFFIEMIHAILSLMIDYSKRYAHSAGPGSARNLL
jgi:hypothetical protein